MLDKKRLLKAVADNGLDVCPDVPDEILSNILSTLPPRQVFPSLTTLVEEYFSKQDPQPSFKTIAERHNRISPEWSRALIAKALRLLGHPKRARGLSHELRVFTDIEVNVCMRCGRVFIGQKQWELIQCGQNKKG